MSQLSRCHGNGHALSKGLLMAVTIVTIRIREVSHFVPYSLSSPPEGQPGDMPGIPTLSEEGLCAPDGDQGSTHMRVFIVWITVYCLLSSISARN